ncbi:hypothetical protein ACA910_013596 [Epithemia clementina (nom. ined.)]
MAKKPKITNAGASAATPHQQQQQQQEAEEEEEMSWEGRLPQEIHRREQYWWSPGTRAFVLRLLRHHEHPCCVFTPSLLLLDPHLPRRKTRILDVDERFLSCPIENRQSFHLFDAWRPVRPSMDHDSCYDLIVLDPPFDTVKCDQLYRAVQVLMQGNDNDKYNKGLSRLLFCYPKRKALALMAPFAEWGLRQCDIPPDMPADLVADERAQHSVEYIYAALCIRSQSCGVW